MSQTKKRAKGCPSWSHTKGQARHQCRRSGGEWQRHVRRIREERVKHKIGVITTQLQNSHAAAGPSGEKKLSHQSGDDRLFLQVDILGRKVNSLLDSGASKCVIGGAGLSLIEDLKLPKYDTEIKRVELADKSCNSVIGQVDVPINLGLRTYLITALILPSVDQTLILGLNFWHETGFIPDIARGTWSLSQNASNYGQLGSLKSEDGDILLGAERQKLLDFIEDIKSKFPSGWVELTFWSILLILETHCPSSASSATCRHRSSLCCKRRWTSFWK